MHGQSHLPPLGVGENFAGGLVRGGGRKREGGQKYELAPHQRGLIVDEAALEADLLKDIDSAAKQSLPAG